MSRSELVSIITPMYNSAAFIRNTIESILSQTYTHWELIIIDDCSEDNSVEIAQEYEKQFSNITVFQNLENSGPAISRNSGIKKASGKYLTFIDSDDLWKPLFIEKSIENVKNSYGFVFSSYERISENGLEKAYHDFIVPNKVNYKDILKTNSISCLTAFIDVERLGKLMMPEVRYRQDMGLWLKYLKKIPFAIGETEVLASYRIRNNSHSRNKIKLIKPQWLFYRKVENLSILSSLYFMIEWILRGLIKYRS